MLIQLSDANNRGCPPYYVADRPRPAYCTSVKLFDDNRLVTCSFAGQRTLDTVRFQPILVPD